MDFSFLGTCFPSSLYLLTSVQPGSQLTRLSSGQPRPTLPDAQILTSSHPACWLSWWLSGKQSACNEGDAGLIPELGRPPGEGNGNPLQYSCLGNPVDREAWWATVHGVAESDMTSLSMHAHPECQTLFSRQSDELARCGL